jgi:hypothetical protein
MMIYDKDKWSPQMAIRPGISGDLAFFLSFLGLGQSKIGVDRPPIDGHTRMTHVRMILLPTEK